ncbi:cadherin domain-containing protein [Microvirga thermotolerans]|nr:cadherin domain-containing protein [Microvirga thermotolerans]
MAVVYFSGTDTFEQYVGSGDHLIVTASGSIESTMDFGVTSTDFPFDVAASIYGFVSGQVTGVRLGGTGSRIFVGTTGVVQGEVSGIFFSTGRVVNQGQVQGGQQGVFVDYTDSSIANTGTISGRVGIKGDENFATRTQISNSGTITAITYGILLPSDSQVTNSGTIEALGGTGSIGVALATKTASVASFSNSGTVLADIAVEGGAGRDTVRNTGQLLGRVSLLDGNDLYDGRGGTVGGPVDLGSGDDTAQGGDGVETFLGGDGDDLILGGGGGDRLDGGAGRDTLDGGAGDDRMSGGDGDDTYLVDSEGDIVAESAGEGADTVRTSISYALTDQVENLVLIGADNLAGTGNALSNIVVGNGGSNTLDGGAGADELRGGLGNDTYIVDDAGDLVVESADEGTDTVRASISSVLAAHVENLVLTGSDDLTGTGNGLTNVIVGNGGSNTLDGGAGADELQGGAGDDLYIVDHSGDLVVENAGDGVDMVRASVSYALAANIENLVLTGGADIRGTGNDADNVIVGNAGNNTLDGGSGADELRGGAGNDTYIVDDAGDLVVENADEGTDTVRASIGYVLGAEVENLTLVGTGNLGGTGNALNNVLIGNDGSNALQGGQGDDTLDGGAGDNVAVFSGQKSDYIIARNGDGSWTVADKRFGHDGTDQLRNIQTLRFSDGTISLATQPADPAPVPPEVSGGTAFIDENARPHATVASVRPVGTVGNGVTYALTSNPGGKFAIDATTGLVTLLGPVNYEAAAEDDPHLQVENAGTPLERKFYTLKVTATDTASGLTSGEKTLVVYVNDINEAPTQLAFADGTRKATITADAQDGAVVGDLTAVDPEGDDGLVFAFDTSGNGGSSGSGNAGGRFKIEDGKLKVAALTNISKTETYTVTIKVSDRNGEAGSASTYKDFLITVNPVAAVNHAPTDVGFSEAQTIKAAVTGAGANVVLATAVDPDTAPEFRNNRYKFADTGGATDASGLFRIDERTGQITTTRGVEAGDAGQKTLQVVAYDGSLESPAKPYTFTIAAADAPVNRAPEGLALSNAVVRELAEAGAIVGTLSAVDRDGDALTYTLVGDGAEGRFAIQGNTIVVANPYKLDYEQAVSHQIAVLASDGKGGSQLQSFAIHIADWTPEFTAGSGADDVFKGGAGNDVLRGNLGNDSLHGAAGRDRLFGDAGIDRIFGGLGNDSLTGGSGRDVFVFDTRPGKANLDRIFDYSAKDDSVWLDNAVFKKLGKGSAIKPGKLNKNFFTVGDKAKDANDYLIYDRAKKTLYYDSDGNGAAKAVAIFTTAKAIKFSAGEFFVV